MKLHKIVAALPATLEPNAVYAVRVGDGFDLWVANNDGTNAYPLNTTPTIETWDTFEQHSIKGGAWGSATGLTVLDGQVVKNGPLVTAKVAFTIDGVSGVIATKSAYSIRTLPYAPLVLAGSTGINQDGVSGFVYSGISNVRDTLLHGGVDVGGKAYFFAFYTGNSEAYANSPVHLTINYLTAE